MSLFDIYTPNSEDAKKVGQAPIIPPGVYSARMVKAEQRHAKLPDGEPDTSKVKFYGELCIETEGAQKGRIVFVHLWIQNTDKTAKGNVKHERGREAFSLLCMECAKQRDNEVPKIESDIIGYCYDVKISVMENKSTGEKSNWCDIIASKNTVQKARDVGTSPAVSTEIF